MNLKEEYLILRRRKAIDQATLAKHLNCSQSLISRYEKGNSGMSQEKIKLYRQYIDNK
ncbi:helix-turn-helix domain-containing protein [Bacillus sp. SD075]|uniref:helix-turn-helix domain-containing protein n=1 Tax=Bacillaceae TaxID=186817 RepID=UPI001A97797E|nr:helix-turn-helix transcriptional regulator [Bacillus sp. SD075]MBO0997400.1 helix-turn-helix domain-containing protein [Bacillus sp. SD075]